MTDLNKFKFWCYKVLPLVYDDSLSYYEVLCKVVNYINKLIDDDKELAANIAELENAINPSRNIILIGDDYGTDTSGSASISPTLPEIVKTSLRISNDKFHYRFSAGSGFINGGFTTLIEALADDMSDDERNKVTEIYVFGGINDVASSVNTVEKFNTNSSVFKETANTLFPNAKLSVGFWASNNSEYSETLYTAFTWYRNLGVRGWNFIQNIRFILHTYNRFSDYTHPNQTGVDALAHFISQYIISWFDFVDYTIQVSYASFNDSTRWIGNWSTSRPTLYYLFNNNYCKFDLEPNVGSTIDFTPAIEHLSISLSGTAIELFELDDNILNAYANKVKLSGFATVMYDGGKAAYLPCYIVIRNGVGYLNLPKSGTYSGETFTPDTLTDVTNIYLSRLAGMSETRYI